jgi:hypothetical protein
MCAALSRYKQYKASHVAHRGADQMQLHQQPQHMYGRSRTAAEASNQGVAGQFIAARRRSAIDRSTEYSEDDNDDDDDASAASGGGQPNAPPRKIQRTSMPSADDDGATLSDIDPLEKTPSQFTVGNRVHAVYPEDGKLYPAQIAQVTKTGYGKTVHIPSPINTFSLLFWCLF